jgi:uncharacterized protein (TIGR03382 family)
MTQRSIFLQRGAAAAALCLAASGASAWTVIDFEKPGLQHGSVVTDQYLADFGVEISAINKNTGPDKAVVFDSRLSNTADPDLEAPFIDFIQSDFNSTSDKNEQSFAGDVRDNGTEGPGITKPGNFLILQENSQGCSAPNATLCSNPDDEGSRPAGSITIKFSVPVILASIDFFDVKAPDELKENEIQLFSSTNTADTISPGQFFTPNTGDDFNWATSSLNNTTLKTYLSDNNIGRVSTFDRYRFGEMGVAGVRMVTINMGGSGAIDNIKFRVQEVSAPASLALLVLGLGLLRRRQGREAASAAPAFLQA